MFRFVVAGYEEQRILSQELKNPQTTQSRVSLYILAIFCTGGVPGGWSSLQKNSKNEEQDQNHNRTEPQDMEGDV